MLFRHYLEQGVGKSELAVRFGASRRIICHWIETDQLDHDLDKETVRYKARPSVLRKLDPYKGIIRERLEVFPDLTAQRLFDEICGAGYPGGYTQVKEYVRSIRPQPPADPLVRFETPAGFQERVDFASFNLPWGRRTALLEVLGYLCLLWLRVYRRKTIEILFSGLESAFACFGGVPQDLLVDQMRTVVISDDRLGSGGLVLNAEFLRFAEHWDFRPQACRPYRARTKGKVERPIRYLRQSLSYGRTFLNDDDLMVSEYPWLTVFGNHEILTNAPPLLVICASDDALGLAAESVRLYSA